MRLFLCLLALVFLGETVDFSNADITDSDHDFSEKSWLRDEGSCQVCHAMHGGDSSGNSGFFWNHRISSATFLIYSSFSLQAIVRQPSGDSLFCLSCHDGTVPVDAFGGRIGTEVSGEVLGTDLHEIHPLSFTYDDALAAKVDHLRIPEITPSGFGKTITKDLLKGGKMECSSCHDVHNRFGLNDFLIKKDGRGVSGLCGICHNKEPPGLIEHGKW